MTVRHSLLAILAQGPCYGYQLRAEFERRTAGAWVVNVGQVYNTLERLHRDGLVRRGDVDAQGHVYWEITEAGRDEALRWLYDPLDRGTARSETAVKIAIAAATPGVDVAAVVDAQLAATRAACSTRAEPDLDAGVGSEAWAGAVIDSATRAALEAEIAWLKDLRERLAKAPTTASGLPLADDRPRRGRPARGSGATSDAGSQRTAG